MLYDLRDIKNKTKVPFSLKKELGIAKAVLRSSFGKGIFVNSLGELVINVKGRSFVAVNSFYTGNVNLIFFRYDGLNLIVAQNHSKNILVHFLKKGISFGGPDSPKGQKAINKILSSSDEYLLTRKSFFGGFIVSHPRPYHFFYDSAPSSFYLQSHYPEAACVAVEDSLWLPPSFFKKSVGIFESNKMMNSASLEGGIVFSAPIISASKSEKLSLFDQKVRDFVNSEGRFGKNEDFFEEKGSSSFLLWFGVCSEKRSLLNEKKVLEMAVRKLMSLGVDLLVVFDGITSPYVKNNATFSSDNKVILYKKFVHELGVKKTLDLTGKSSLEKLCVARYADFFITSFLTDSIYVSRFYGVNGIAHGSESFKLEQHVHGNADFLFGKSVEKSLNWSTESYSVDVEKFEEMLDSKVKGELK